MGGGGFNQGRQLGGNVSFAQSLSGSQPATPLDPTYVPATLHCFRPFPQYVTSPETSSRGEFSRCPRKPSSSTEPATWHTKGARPTHPTAWPTPPW